MGRVFSIEEFSTFDGPGIRTTVFLKGCPLRCSWCHNPEGQTFEAQYVRSPNGCAKCGRCEAVAKKENGKTELTYESMLACERNLIRKSGTDYTPIELAAKLNKNADILAAAGGGITFSGGEPLAQFDFIQSVSEMLDKRLSVAIQTSGFSSEETFKKALEICDYVLYDLKIMDGAMHQKFCGAKGDLIKRNYATLARSGKRFVTRVPLIPTVTDTKENLKAIAEFLVENGVHYVEVLPYNKMAGSKYAMVLRSYEPGFDESVEVNIGEEIFHSYGVQVVKM